jgi:hypothetical protein
MGFQLHPYMTSAARRVSVWKVIFWAAIIFSHQTTPGAPVFHRRRPDRSSFGGGMGGLFFPDNNELVASGSAYSTRLAALGGWAPKHWLGINGYVEAGRGEYNEDDNETILGGGLTGGVDFKNLDIIPIGVQLVARTTGVTSGGADLATRSWTYGMGFFYTGWDEFSISFEASINTFQRRGDGEDFESFVGSFNIRYWP